MYNDENILKNEDNLSEEEKFNDSNIMTTLLKDDNSRIILYKYLNNIDTNMYSVYRNFINKNKIIDFKFFNEIISKVKDAWYIDIESLYNIDIYDSTYSFSIIVDTIDCFHFDLKDVIFNVLKNNDKQQHNLFENINKIIEHSRGKLKSILKILDVDTVYKIVDKFLNIYGDVVKAELIQN